ncbi:PREDICTED: eukaryotic translation initiation factor 3 subunit E [Bactrocera latifrons]|uniref:Eukaryotic translation initiation factor 3 subunit E n=3 Tax=Endopterygota TaxID=33392 RepID=A0A034VN85_BACDO|nr:eukaryotic translation initiation factor 3 subunit E [Bactrocera dorsalis]XP_018803830.1 PREDICTED: eukaryotic translation initiation factor 3 subunit E [Bactrocera latifrons]XP_039957288.1 eukaryotic translation initiation factor 3 subunit E [Bactrocera tryoni]XP_050336221.1 eukaryotic translation initiation factor 3 subunit E [Bactrocera neohumeralis]
MAQFDLTRINCQFLDRHLTFPLLEFLCGKEIYNQQELLEYILDTVNKTNMIDYTMDTRKRLNLSQEMPEELVQRKAEVLATLKQLQNEVAPIMKATDILKNGESMKDSKTFVNALQKDYNFKVEHLESAYKLAKYLYECGNYQESTSYLYFCLIVMSPNDKNYLNVLWGKLAAEILTLNWNTALEDLTRLRDYIDNANFTTIQALQQRTWLIHWSVLVFFNHPKGRDLIIDMFLYKPLYLNAIQTMCPHIMRYLATAVIINRTRRNALKDLIKVIQQESYTYRDPITEFLECLYVNFDFEGARLKLHECQTVILNDFFIVACLSEFVEDARLMIFETFCRIHQCITISMLADKLNMKPSEAECWIVNLIRNARLNAKIDSKLGHVVMGTQPLSPYQQLVEKIDSLSMRSEHLAGLIERKSKQKNPESADSWKYY